MELVRVKRRRPLARRARKRIARRANGVFERLLAGKSLSVPHLSLSGAPGAFQAHFGRCLTDLNRFEEAEPQLLAACEGEMAVRGEAHKNTRKVIEHLAHLYEIWDMPEQAAKWRPKLPTVNPAPGPNGQQP